MAWFDRGAREKEEQLKERGNPIFNLTKAVEEVPAEASGDEQVACLYKGSRVTGQLTFHGAARIDGCVEGEVLCHGVLTIGEGAEVRAKISANVVMIRGKVEGDVTAKEKVELGGLAWLSGNIDSPRLVVSEGVVFDGHCSMRGAREKGEVLSTLSSSSE
jgi:cytoskeletal protein CcmA (bactofilin family)